MSLLYYQLPAESDSEQIVKISQHLAMSAVACF